MSFTNKYCTSCGTQLSTECPNCGKTLWVDEVYCGKCGTKNPLNWTSNPKPTFFLLWSWFELS